MRIRKSVVSIFVVFIVLAAVSAASAAVFRGERLVTVEQDVVVEDEFYAAAQTVSVNGSVLDDLLAAGNQVTIRGRVGESASLAGSTVDISGAVDGNLRAVGGTLEISGKIGRNATVAGGTVVVSRGASILRDLQVGAGTVRISGNTDGNVRIGGGQVNLDGEIGGNARIDAAKLVIGPRAVIRGNLVYASPQRAEIDPAAQILGDVVFREKVVREKEPSRYWKLSLWLLCLTGIYAVGCLLLAIAPVSVRGTTDKLAGSPWLSLLLGLILIAVLPALIAIALATVIGIPLGLILLAMYLIVLYISRVFVGLAIGRFIVRKLSKSEKSPYIMLLVGLIILWALLAIPICGRLIHVIAILFGLGAIALSRYAQIRDLRADGRI